MEPVYDPEHLFKNYHPDEQWFTESKIAKAIEYFLWEFSNLNAPRDYLERIDQEWINFYTHLFSGSPASRVLIIGSGFGILPLLAARAGKQVYALDRYPVLAKISQDIIQTNAKEESSRIKFIFKDLKEVTQGPDFPELCDMLVFDDFDHTLLETGFIPLLEHCKKHLLSPGAVLVPEKATVYARCVELQIDATWFDLHPLARHLWSTGAGPFAINETRYRWLSEAREVYSFDFNRPVSAQRTRHSFTIQASGTWNAVVCWYELYGKPVYSLQYIDERMVGEGTQEEVTVYQLKSKIRCEPRGGVNKQRTECLQSWHVDMVNDAVRNTKYYAGIGKALQDKGPCRVLDIGCGSGLLSLMAARLNAQCHVDGCEVLQGLSATATEIVRANGLQDRVAIINTDVRSAVLPEKADFILHEVAASGLLGEGVLHFLHHAKEHLAKPDAVYIPQAARVTGMLVEHWQESVLGVNIEAVNAYRWHPDYSSLDLAETPHQALSAPFPVFEFDFAHVELKPASREEAIPVTAGGTANAVVYWFELLFAGDVVLSTSPFEPKTCWHQAIQYVQATHVQPGDLLPVKIEHDCYKIHYSVLLEKLAPAIRPAAVPEYDARWSARFLEIEKQYQQMIMRAVATEEGAAELFAAAVKIASDPGCFGVRAKFASRLAASLFIR